MMSATLSASSAGKTVRRSRVLASVLLLIALSSVLFFYRLDDRDLWSSHEGRAAQDAQSMVGDGYWGIPRLFDQQLDLQKPPLYYWCVAGVSWLRGGSVDAWSVRLPAALSALALVLVMFVFDRRQAGLITAGILATAVHFTWLARIGRIDMPLTLAISVGLLAFFRAGQSANRAWPWYLLAYMALAVAVLLKGPIGLVLPAAVMGLHLLVEARREGRDVILRFARSLLWGIPVLVLLALPWFIWAAQQTDGRLLRTFFWYHNIERAFGGGQLRGHPWWFYGPRLFVDFLPWSVLLPWAIVTGTLRVPWGRAGHVGPSCDDEGGDSGGRHAERACYFDAEARFGLVWLVAMVLVLSFARFKRADYLLPAYPGAALFLGRFLWLRLQAPSRAAGTVFERWGWKALMVTAILGTVLGWGYFVTAVLPRSEPERESRSFAAAIRSIAPAPQLVVFFRVESHALAFHVGRPLNTVLEWENIDIWVSRPGEHYFVMPPDCARQWAQHITAAELEVIGSNTDGGSHEHPLVLLRTKRKN
jgi:4-amino-4-deoxy-L-arabinose transferase-like glycosyltransferase